MVPYQDIAQQNEDQNQLGWQLENPIYDHFSMKKRRAPFFGPMDSFRIYRGSAIDLQNETKKQGSIGVEITEPIHRGRNLRNSFQITCSTRLELKQFFRYNTWVFIILT